MNERFRDLARFVADESRDGNQGCQISRDAALAYQEMLAIYDGIMAEEFISHDSFERRMDGVRNFIGDIPRTVLMIRAMARAIRAKGEGAEVNFVEAGSGSGLLCGVAAALDDKVHVSGIDAVELKVEATRALLKRLEVDEKRWEVRRADILKEPHEGRVDVLVAEHISRGLKTEHATKIPRAFDVDPNFVVPYAVTPVVMWGDRISYDPERKSRVGFPLSSVCDFGKEIVLANHGDSEVFLVEGTTVLRPGLTPVLVGSDIRWASPLLPGKSLYQSNKREVSFDVDGVTHNHLIGPALLSAGFCMDMERIKGNPYKERVKFWGIDNLAWRCQPTRFAVSYPIGFEDPLYRGGGGVGLQFSNENLRVVSRFASEFAEE